MLHIAVKSSKCPLVCDSFSVFPVFLDLDGFKEHWSHILRMSFNAVLIIRLR